MKKINRLLFTGMAAMAGLGLSAQTYTSLTPYQTITANSQTFTFTFAAPPNGAHSMAHLTVYYQGDFGDAAETITVKGESGNTMGATSATGLDCSPEDSLTLAFPADSINVWLADNNVNFTLTTSADVDEDVCTTVPDQIRVRLSYSHCNFPVQELANMTLTDSIFCKSDPALMLTGTPAGGTFSGTGVMGNLFSPAGLSGGDYAITYTAADALGCATSKTKYVRVKRSPVTLPAHACPGGTTLLQVDAVGGEYVWFTDTALTQMLDSGVVVTSPVLNQSTPYYVAGVNSEDSFKILTLTAANNSVINHDTQSGDDRGGIAITPDHLYIVGDNNTVRLDAAGLTNPVSLPRRDGIFSDLKTGQLWTFWNRTDSLELITGNLPLTCDALRGMDSALAFTDEYIVLSQPIVIDDNVDAAVLAGYGKVGLFNGGDSHFYVIDMDNGVVQDLGSDTENFYGSENWADWGILEYDGNEYSAIYRPSTGNRIIRKVLPAGIQDTVQLFTDLNDMSSITFSPWHNRWYFHYENTSDQFGGSTENGGYADATFSSTVFSNNELGCYSEVSVDVNVIDFGADQTICYNEVPVILSPGLGYSSYTWNGDNNNFNTFYVSQSGTYTAEVVDEYGCTIADSINITVKPAPAATFDALPELVCIDGQDVALNGIPTGGIFSGTGVTGTMFDPTAAGLGAETLTYTYTDADNCVGTAIASIYVSQCLDVEESEAFASVVLFPNPATGITNLQVESAVSQDFTLEVLDMTGKRLYSTRLMGVTGTYTHTIDVSAWSAGVYNVRLTGSEKGSKQIRLIKQ